MSDAATRQPRLKNFVLGTVRGAKFGALAGLVIALVMLVVSVGIVVFNPQARHRALAEIADSPLSTIGETIAGVALIMFYGALTGAVIMGLMNVLRTPGR